MKTFLVALCFAAFVAHIRADALDEYLMEDEEDGEPDRHPYIQCKIDLYDCVKAGQSGKLQCLKDYRSCMSALIPTIPPFVIQCKDQLKACLRSSFGLLSFGMLGKAKCFLAFAMCLKNRGPAPGVVFDVLEDGKPTRHPYVQCKIDLYDCIKAGQKGKLECLKDYKNCMAVLVPTIPPFVIACKDDLKTCLSSSSGILAKARCFKTLAICLKNRGSSFDAPAFDDADQTRHPLIQCKLDLYNCIKDGQKGKLECAKDYKNCMLHSFVLLCNEGRKACMASARGWKERVQCRYGFLKCLYHGGPSSGLLFDAEQDGEPTRHPYVQCKIDLYDCVKSDKDKKVCLSEYKTCMSVLLPTVPPFIVQCHRDFRTCYASANSWAGKLKCGPDLFKCLKNKGVSL